VRQINAPKSLAAASLGVLSLGIIVAALVVDPILDHGFDRGGVHPAAASPSQIDQRTHGLGARTSQSLLGPVAQSPETLAGVILGAVARGNSSTTGGGATDEPAPLGVVHAATPAAPLASAPSHVVTTPPLGSVTGPVLQLLQPVTQPVVQLLQPVTQSVGSVTKPVVQVVQPVIQPVMQLVQPVTQPVLHLVQPVTQPVSQLLQPLAPTTPSSSSSTTTMAPRSP
jgi:hypothetical protein